MKRLIQILLLAVSTAASAQNGFVPVLPGIGYSEQPVNLQGTHSYAYVRGHWVPLDNLDKRSELAGPSISEISCDYQEKTCHEQQANILVMGNDFDLTDDSMDYPVVRWNSKEILAQNISGR